jgi:hypothetical protein
MATRGCKGLVHTDSCKAGESVKIAKDAENHWACKAFVGKVGKLRAKDDYAGTQISTPTSASS